jgi:hypothetical protein
VVAGWAPALATPAGFDHGYESCAVVLRAHVMPGMVSYSMLRDSGAADLQRCLDGFSAVTRADHAAFTERERTAFWINAYNFHALKLVADRMPLASVRSIGLLPGAAFRERFIPIHVLSDKDMTLNDITNHLASASTNPRAFLALCCAAKGCPELRRSPYRADALDSQLHDAAQRFIRDGTKNQVDVPNRVLRLSPVFKWYRTSFEKESTHLGRYLAPYVDSEAYDVLRHAGASMKVEFLELDWSLNGY